MSMNQRYLIKHDRDRLEVEHSRIEIFAEDGVDDGFDLGSDETDEENYKPYPKVVPYRTSPLSGDAAESIPHPAWTAVVAANRFAGLRKGEAVDPDNPESYARYYLKTLEYVSGGWVNANLNRGKWPPTNGVHQTIPDNPADWEGKKVFVEGVKTGGGMVEGVEDLGRAIRIAHMSWEAATFMDSMSWYYQPHLINRWTSIWPDGRVHLTGNGMFTPTAHSGVALYMLKDDLEQIPQLPMVVSTTDFLNCRKHPTTAAEIITKYPPGVQLTLVDYHFWGSDIWCKLAVGGWVCVRWGWYDGAHHFTTWKMTAPMVLPESPKVIQPVSDFEAVEPPVVVDPEPEPQPEPDPEPQPDPLPEPAYETILVYEATLKPDLNGHKYRMRFDTGTDTAKGVDIFEKDLLDANRMSAGMKVRVYRHVTQANTPGYGVSPYYEIYDWLSPAKTFRERRWIYKDALEKVTAKEIRIPIDPPPPTPEPEPIPDPEPQPEPEPEPQPEPEPEPTPDMPDKPFEFLVWIRDLINRFLKMFE